MLAAFCLPLILGGLGLLMFTGVTLAGIAFLVLTLLLLVVGVGLLIAAGVSLVSSPMWVERRYFAVTGHPHLLVHNEAGSIQAHAGSAGHPVTVKTKRHTRRVEKAAAESWACYAQSGDGNKICAKVDCVCAPGTNLPQPIDFELLVPGHADLDLLKGGRRYPGDWHQWSTLLEERDRFDFRQRSIPPRFHTPRSSLACSWSTSSPACRCAADVGSDLLRAC